MSSQIRPGRSRVCRDCQGSLEAKLSGKSNDPEWIAQKRSTKVDEVRRLTVKDGLDQLARSDGSVACRRKVQRFFQLCCVLNLIAREYFTIKLRRQTTGRNAEQIDTKCLECASQFDGVFNLGT